MVTGIDIFKKYFSDYKDQYVLIGGAACDILLSDADRNYRATKDLDLVLIVEALTPEFGNAFWEFIKAGKYRNRSRSSGEMQFYRFDKPETAGYPYMLELFSKRQRNLALVEGMQVFTPLYIGDEVSSLSAILLNESYYRLLLDKRKELDGVMLLETEAIIAFKAKAWLDLSKKKENGIHVDTSDINKHKNDIARLAMILEGRSTQQMKTWLSV